MKKLTLNRLWPLAVLAVALLLMLVLAIRAYHRPALTPSVHTDSLWSAPSAEELRDQTTLDSLNALHP